MKFRKLASMGLLVSLTLLTGCFDQGDKVLAGKQQELAKREEARQHSFYADESNIPSGQKPVGSHQKIDLSKFEVGLSYRGNLIVSSNGDWAVLVAESNKKGKTSSKLLLVNIPEKQITSLHSGENLKIFGWTPDSRKVLYSGDGLFLIDIEFKTKRKLSNTAKVAALSTNGKKIAFVDSRGGLYVTSVDKEDSRLISDRVQEQPLLWYPDNRRILFVEEGDDQNLIRLSRVYDDGSGKKVLIRDVAGEQFQPEWLVPGEKVVYSIAYKEAETYWLMDLVEQKALQLGSENPDSNRQASILVQQDKFEVLIAGKGLMNTYDVQGQPINQGQLDDATFHNYDYRYSPDKEKLSYLYGSPGEEKLNNIRGRRLWVNNLATNTTTVLTPSYGNYSSPQWVDNSNIAFIEAATTKDAQVFKLWIVNIGG